MTILAVAVLFAAVTGSVAAAPVVLPRLTGWLALRSRMAPLPPARGRPTPITRTPLGTGPASVQLVAQDLTPNTQLKLKGAGFMGGEHLAVTIEDIQGQPYMQVTLTAGDDGRLRETSLALPPQLGAGNYRLVVVGSMSHRTASSAFRMHVVPPTVALDAYTAKPGQDIGFAGSGFIPREEVTISLGRSSPALAHAQATDRGDVSGHLSVPALAAGTYTLTLVGAVSQTPASVGFNIQGFAPWVVLDRYTLMPGEGLGLIGQGFAPSEPVLIYLNSPHGSPARRVTADPSGRIVVQDTWAPSGMSGRNVLTFVGQWSKATTSVEFTILPPLAAQPTPSTITP
jgi:hypothetical protein